MKELLNYFYAHSKIGNKLDRPCAIDELHTVYPSFNL